MGPGGGAHHADARAGVLAGRHARGRLRVAEHARRRVAARPRRRRRLRRATTTGCRTRSATACSAAGGSSRSSRSLTMDMGNGAYVKLSEGPASGRDALVSAAVAWILAAALAVGLAALAGYLVARAHRAAGGRAHRGERPDGRRRPRRPRARRRRRRGRAPRRVLQRHGGARRDHGDVAAPLRRRRGARDRHAAHGARRPISSWPSARPRATTSAASSTGRSSRPRASRRSPTTCCSSRASRPASPPAASAERRPRRGGPRAGRRRGLAGRAGRRRARRSTSPTARSRSPSERARLQTVLANLLDNARQVHARGRHGDAHRAAGGRRGAGARSPTPASASRPRSSARSSSASTARATSRPIPGNGLGLAIVKAAVERSGGTVSFASSAGRHDVPRDAAAGLGGAGVAPAASAARPRPEPRRRLASTAPCVRAGRVPVPRAFPSRAVAPARSPAVRPCPLPLGAATSPCRAGRYRPSRSPCARRWTRSGAPGCASADRAQGGRALLRRRGRLRPAPA